MSDLIWLLFQPYVLLLMALAALVVVAWRQTWRPGVRLALAGVLVLGWLLATPLVGRALSNLVVAFTPASAELAETSRAANNLAVVVLTGGIREQAALGWLPTPHSVQRALVGLELYGQLAQRVPLILSGGYTHGPVNPSEARVVANFLSALRAERLPLVLEDISLNTVESAREVRKLAESQGFSTALLVTDDLHLPRAMGVYRRAGLNVVGVPVLTQPTNRGLRELWPGIVGLQRTHAAAYELYALAGYALAGWLKL